MDDEKQIYHAVAIAGIVQDKVSQQRIARALVEILSGPPAFQAIVQTRAADSAWFNRTERIDRTWSQVDGIFYFTDLPPGDYRLRVSVVDLPQNDYRLRGSLVTIPPRDYRLNAKVWHLVGTRYGSFETTEKRPLHVSAPQANKPIAIARADIQLSPTRIHGIVTTFADSKPVVGAWVHLRGDTTGVHTLDDGSYELAPLVAGKPTVEVTATGYKITTHTVTLEPGQDRLVNLKLHPK